MTGGTTGPTFPTPTFVASTIINLHCPSLAYSPNLSTRSSPRQAPLWRLYDHHVCVVGHYAHLANEYSRERPSSPSINLDCERALVSRRPCSQKAHSCWEPARRYAWARTRPRTWACARAHGAPRTWTWAWTEAARHARLALVSLVSQFARYTARKRGRARPARPSGRAHDAGSGSGQAKDEAQD